jgi:hypothetical protein
MNFTIKRRMIDNSKKTLITHIYNEEYLLPLWLEHHKKYFDHLIVIDYNSTDKSVEICNKIWNGCKIIPSRNKEFDAQAVDNEVMDIENNINGIKMVLNTTEFLITDINIKNEFNKNKSIGIRSYCPVSRNNAEFNNTNDLFRSLLDPEIKFSQELALSRGYRQLHNLKNGKYTLGRHSSNNPFEQSDKIFIIWFGFYPMNELVMKRKLQIKNKMSKENKLKGFGYQHLWDENKIISEMNEKYDSGKDLQSINNNLFKVLNQ